ncbi:MAG: PRC-barrel domain-containing protein [Roseovarius sp.]
MLMSYNDLTQFALEAKDGRKGRAEDFYFDDESWRIRYMVTESGFLLTRREGLVNSSLLGTPDAKTRTLPCDLTKAQIEAAETPNTHPPVSEQRKRDIRERQIQMWPPLMLGVPGAAYTPRIAEDQLFGGPVIENSEERAKQTPGDPHLRSMSEVSGYAVEAKGGEKGSVIDFLVDPAEWQVRFLVADTGNWLPGRQAAIRTSAITSVNLAAKSIVVDMTKQAVEDAPELSEMKDLERSDVHLAVAQYGAYGGMPM